MRLKFERRRKMLREIRPVVAAGIQMKLVGDFARVEQIMKRLRAHVEAVLVLGAAIKINFQSRSDAGRSSQA